MKTLKSIIIFALIAIKTAESVCPADITPCKCYDATPTYNVSQVRCGDSTKDPLTTVNLKSALDKLSGNFDILYIHDTTIDIIGAEAVKTATFNKIFIENNAELTDIAADAFNAKVQPTTISIRNNRLFIGTNIFKIVKDHGKSLVYLELDHNSIGDIPIDALNSADKSSLQSLQYIRLDNQNPKSVMTKIGNNAFANLPSLHQLSLDNNAIVNIGDATLPMLPGIDLSSIIDDKRHVSIFLNNNDILPDDLVETKIKLSTHGTVGLVLEENSKQINLKTSMNLFLPIATKVGGKVYLTNSKAEPVCNCKDITELSQKVFKSTDPNINKNIIGVKTCAKAQPTDKENDCITP